MKQWYRTTKSVEVTGMQMRGNFETKIKATKLQTTLGQMTIEQIRGKLAYANDRIIAGTKLDRQSAARILEQTKRYCTTDQLRKEHEFVAGRLA
jgi:alpha-D-ribose 1-methylphosphonate 5-triphosphate synthase subunit PhnI